MHITKEKLKTLIKEELIRTADMLAPINENQKVALAALTELTDQDAATVIAIYESIAAEKK
tara:strand:+ start:2032 stop:2214 length:183 start_codon:yes stop_codon:yes gene_type:complete